MNKGYERLTGGEVVSDEEIIMNFYDTSGLEGLLHSYLARRVESEDVAPALASYSDKLAALAYGGTGHIDVGVVRQGFEELSQGLDRAIQAEIVTPKGLAGVIYKAKRGRQPVPEHTRRLGDRFWDGRFLQEYEAGNVFYTQPHDSSLGSFKEYVRGNIEGYMWSIFTYSQG